MAKLAIQRLFRVPSSRTLFNLLVFQDAESNDEESDEDSVDLSWLPDPDKIYGKSKGGDVGDDNNEDDDDDDDDSGQESEEGESSSEDER